ncbi:DNA polymerase III subunit epsilon [Endozoicomonas gorgoniicola]|uniref:DNA polymerase III subunit epsilon n=1 Tax=Endozoicomonas gorgoniicola TaxID=1234144 RepID=A0ABT3MT25_9GAMM|nr:DNA polymerase III subunit epsilon [Endozoicomonas gorgoniicola]MCW7552536.1 DNA polymerase III subunit epsilon [Endozoicomonas gorgoniicola]
MAARQIVMDTETTGIDPKSGHRIVEIGCVEMIDRKLTGNTFHVYINPEREMDAEVIAVHGITNEFVKDKPLFNEVADDFLAFIKDSEMIAHNATFDVNFLNHEFKRLRRGLGKVEDYCTITDSLELARKKHPGQKNNLDALCKRYFIDNSSRVFHGALLDSEILAEVYLAMTGGQTSLLLGGIGGEDVDGSTIRRLPEGRPLTRVIRPTADEMQLHREKQEKIGQDTSLL